jgi:hypothetical protein
MEAKKPPKLPIKGLERCILALETLELWFGTCFAGVDLMNKLLAKLA